MFGRMPISFMLAVYALFGGGHESSTTASPVMVPTTTPVPPTEHQATIDAGADVVLDSAVVAESPMLEPCVNALTASSLGAAQVGDQHERYVATRRAESSG